jgi:hypothetical protein
MQSAASSDHGILPSNVRTHVAPQHEAHDNRETLADLATGVGALALLATCLTVIGPHFGGPVPGLAFWRTFGPLLLLPLAILLGLTLMPGGLPGGESANTRSRIGFAVAGLGLFVLALACLNGPSILLLGH